MARMFIEGLRTDSLYFLKETIGEVIRVSQVLSGLMVIGGIIFAVFFYKQGFFTVGDKVAEEIAIETAEDETETEEIKTEEIEIN